MFGNMACLTAKKRPKVPPTELNYNCLFIFKKKHTHIQLVIDEFDIINIINQCVVCVCTD